MGKTYIVYILSNYLRTVLYIGVTNNLCKRVWEHRQEQASGFTQTYHVHSLLYYEQYTDPMSAIEREKQLKRWKRAKKESLIRQMNPKLDDLYPSVCS